MMKIALVSTIAVVAQAAPACKDNHLTWKTTWGACPSYAKGKSNHNWCKWDKKNGLYAKEVCPQCKSCVSKAAKKTAFPTRFPTARPTAFPTQAKATTLMCSMNPKGNWNAGWGKCVTYAVGKMNHAYCKHDKFKGVTANQACEQCGKCTDAVDHTSCQEWTCAQWCEHYDAKYDTVYAASGCEDDGNDDCKCL